MIIFLLIINILAVESPFWENIQKDIIEQQELVQEINQTKSTSQNQNKIEDEFIAVGLEETTHMKNFKKISEMSREVEQVYIQCIRDIPDNDYNQINIENCVGKDVNFLNNDFDYMLKSILSIFERRIRNLMIEDCYTAAGADLGKQKSCDLLERDIIKLLWMEVDFYDLVNEHSYKYTYEQANLKQETFDKIMKKVKDLESQEYEIINEIYNHRDLTIVKVKTEIDRRTKVIMKKAAEAIQNPQPMRFKHEISVVEEVENPGQVNINQLPHETSMDPYGKMFKERDNIYVDQFKKVFGDDQDDLSRNFSEMGPIITIPTKKEKKSV